MTLTWYGNTRQKTTLFNFHNFFFHMGMPIVGVPYSEQRQMAPVIALVHARALWRTAHVAGAMSLEALKGTPVAFDKRIHAARPHAAARSRQRQVLTRPPRVDGAMHAHAERH